MYVPVSMTQRRGYICMYIPVSVRPTGGIYVRTHICDTQKGVYMYVYTCICEA